MMGKAMTRIVCALLFLCALAPTARADPPGAYLLLELDQTALRRQRLADLAGLMARALREASPAISAADPRSDDAGAHIRVLSSRERTAARRAIEAALASRDMREWVTLEDAKGWIEARFTNAAWGEILKMAQAQSLAIIRLRLDNAKDGDMILESLAQGRILVRDAHESDVRRLRARIGVTDPVTFHLVRDEYSPFNEALPSDVVVAQPHAIAAAQQPEIVNRSPLMTGERLARVNPAEDVQTGMIVLSLQFDGDGARTFCQITRDHTGSRFAILLDGSVLTAPRIVEAVCGGSLQISGSFDTASATDLANLLRSGAMPTPLRIVDQGVGAP